jgi:hypothetical protein
MNFSDYNRNQLVSYQAIIGAANRFSSTTAAELNEQILPYLHFRRKVEDFHQRYFAPTCRQSCFDTKLSACCGFESIIIFFADQAINYLLSTPGDLSEMMKLLERPNTSGTCVYLGEEGCIWCLRPITCAMFFCDQAKAAIFGEHPEAKSILSDLQGQEKEFTWPDKPVLFDEIEKRFMSFGVKSPLLYFHQSPGLLRLKARAAMENHR